MVQWDPEEYARSSSAQLAWARELLARLRLRGDEAVLDIGCGDGKITAEIAQHLPRGRVVGIDASVAMIEYARKTYPPERHPNLDFLCRDARALRLAPSFDLAFSNATLHWIDDQRAVLQGVHDALHRGGRLIISCGGRGNAAAILGLLDELVRQERWAPFFCNFEFSYHFLGEEEYAPWLDEAGFKPTVLALVDKDMVHDGPEGLAAWIRTTWMPYTERVPLERREEFIGEVVQRYLTRHPLDAEGKAHVRMVRLEVDALRTN